ncbi:MAG: hypothetical protein AAB513_02485 [Patescibacteria group bacterium]
MEAKMKNCLAIIQRMMWEMRWLRHKIIDFFLNVTISPIISWRISGFFDWDIWLFKWPLFGGHFRVRIHFAVCMFNFRRWEFGYLGGASGTRIGLSCGEKWGWQIGFDNGWEKTEDQRKWILLKQAGPNHLYPYKILPWKWHPFWYPKQST